MKYMVVCCWVFLFFLGLYLESPQKPEKQMKKKRLSVRAAAISVAARSWGCLSTDPTVSLVVFSSVTDV